MSKQPYMAFFTGDWLKDPKLSLCSPATRGIWIDLICALHELAHGGQVTGTLEQLARLCRCSVAEMDSALTQLQTHQAAEIRLRDDAYTVICRRLRREAEISRKRAEAGSKSKAKHQQKPEGEDEDEILRKVIDFTEELGLPESDARWFFHKCQANGWTNGGREIKSWQDTIRSWKHGGYLPSQRKAAVNQNGRLPTRGPNI